MKKEVVIIGGVAAGMSCAAKLQREDPETRITIFEKGPHISYGACGLPYYIGDLIKDPGKLIVRTPEDFKEKRVDVHIHHQVLQVHPSKKTVTVKDLDKNETFEKSYDTLLISTGAAPITPKFMEEAPKNVFTLRDIPDGKRIKEAALLSEVKNIVIVGGGYIGLELVESFHSLGKNVTLINRSGKIMKTYDEEIREILLDELEDKNINLHLSDNVEGFKSNAHGYVTHVVTDQKAYEADLVVMAIGVAPGTKFLENTGIQTLENGAIITNNRMETNLKDVYAAGDCASVHHKLLDMPVHIPLATHASKQGRILAEILAGKDKTFPGALGTSVVKILDLTLAQTGLNEKQARDHGYNFQSNFIKAPHRAGYYPDNSPVYIKYIFDKDSKVLLGAQLAGTKGVAHRINTLVLAIDQGLTLEDILLSDFAYAPPFSGTWDALQVAAKASL
ncbi:CoA-disulfide reductase [Isachenkonia alkalipeptolytica]|uniref:CoA-disulfide reductase n=1 Tax=Isachenkonia alkalipeptolytica TaxID=2565777 RepID=A0AA43XL47_9CLOT|nr:CoA-disulfide reductase [Isachenkonia alkalipeptolytica]NBG88381.1 CoA-disulfide reductase [Isachenkonia alkalipeptolytica]